MRGSCRQNPTSGTWYGRVDLPRGTDGRRRQLRVKGSTKRAVEAKIADAIAKVRRGEFGPVQDRMLMDELFDRFLAAKARLKFRTRGSYEDQIRLYLRPRFGKLYVSKVGRGLIQVALEDWVHAPRLDGKSGRRSSRTVGCTLGVLRMVMAYAVSLELRGDNPVDLVRRPRVDPRPEVDVEPVRLQALLEAAKREGFEVPTRLLLATGLRRGEILALHWGDWDAVAKALDVRRALECRGKIFVVGTPKNASSWRTVFVDDGTAAALEAHREEQRIRLAMFGKTPEAATPILDFVNGAYWHPDAFGRRFRRLIRSAGLTALMLHGTRHAFTSLAMDQGIPGPVVSAALGHASGDMRRRVYTHVFDHARRRLADAVGGAIDRMVDGIGDERDPEVSPNSRR